MCPNACLICGADLVYSDRPTEMECAICHRKFVADCRCADGHYVCDMCHMGSAEAAVFTVCNATGSKDPLEIAYAVMRCPGIHMHGPEHHIIVGASLITAYRNAGGDVDLTSALQEMVRRGGKVPGGACGNAGCCGAAVSAGIFFSIVTRTSPMSTDTWGLANRLTGLCLSRIGDIGGPRCCKRDSTIAIETAVEFAKEHLGISMERRERPVCEHSSENAQCLKGRCPFHPE